MSARTLLLILLAIITAAFTAFYARNWMQAQRAAILASGAQPAAVQAAPAALVLVTNKTLPAGSFLKADDLKWQAWPEDGVIDSYAVKGEREEKDFVGAVVRTAIAAGEPLTDSRVVHPGDRGFLAAVLEPGKRAVSVPVNATTGISGFIFPGDWVDVILTVRFREVEDGEPKGEPRFFSETLLTDVRVLGVDQAVENTKGEAAVAKTATLEVDPKQVEKIAIGLEMGSLSLSLHSLAREQDPFSQIARAIGADPVETTGRSYTMDNDVYYMREDFLAARGKKQAKPQVTVLRGSKAEAAAF